MTTPFVEAKRSLAADVVRTAVFLALGSACALALAQVQGVAPSQVTPPLIEPPPRLPSPAPILQPREVPPQESAGDRLQVRIDHVVVEDGLVGMEDAAATLVSAVQGHRLVLAEIRRLVGELELAYRQRGFFLVRVVLPPQRISDGGSLRVVVVNGFIERIDAGSVPAAVRAPVLRRLEPLLNHRGLTLQEAEARIRVAGSLSGLRLRSALEAGAQAGGSTLLLSGEFSARSFSFSADNQQPDSIGSDAFMANLSVNSAFGAGERWYVALGSGSTLRGWDSNDAPFILRGAGVAAPVGIEGWLVNPEYTQTITNPVTGPGTLRLRGTLSRSTIRLVSPVVERGDSTASAQATLESIAQRQYALDFHAPLNDDQYRVLRLNLDGGTAIPPLGTTVSASAQWSQGLGGRRPDSASAAPLSRQGAGPQFHRMTMTLRVNQPLAGPLQGAIVVSGQDSFGHAMLVPEQFDLGGPEGVSGHVAGSLPVDSGATVRSELSSSWPVELQTGLQMTIAPYLFGAVGRGRLVQPTSVETSVVRARSKGVGLRLVRVDIGGTQGILSAEAARLTPAPGEDGHHWNLGLRFSLSN